MKTVQRATVERTAAVKIVNRKHGSKVNEYAKIYKHAKGHDSVCIIKSLQVLAYKATVAILATAVQRAPDFIIHGSHGC